MTNAETLAAISAILAGMAADLKRANGTITISRTALRDIIHDALEDAVSDDWKYLGGRQCYYIRDDAFPSLIERIMQEVDGEQS